MKLRSRRRRTTYPVGLMGTETPKLQRRHGFVGICMKVVIIYFRNARKILSNFFLENENVKKGN